MSYRSFKHLLGETSLERKCRFIFGLGILVLVSASFFWYGQKTESLVRKQTTQTARMLVGPTLLNIHYKALGNNNFEPVLKVLVDDFKPLDDLPKHEAWVLDPEKSTDAKIRHDPAGSAGAKALARYLASQREQLEAANARYEKWAVGTGSRREAARKANSFPDLVKMASSLDPARQATHLA